MVSVSVCSGASSSKLTVAPAAVVTVTKTTSCHVTAGNQSRAADDMQPADPAWQGFRDSAQRMRGMR